MPVSQDIHHYPKMFWDIEAYIIEHIDTLFDRSCSIPLDCGTKAAAFNIRLRFYGFRKLRLKQGASATINRIQVRYEAPSTLVFEVNPEALWAEEQLRKLGVPDSLEEAGKAALARFEAGEFQAPQTAQATQAPKQESQDDILRRLGYYK